MANDLIIDVGISKRSLAAFRRNGEILPRQLARVAQSAANAVALDARKRLQKAVNENFDDIEPITERAIFARQRRLDSVSTTRDITAEVGIRKLQNRWIRYHLGDGDQTRHPGEIGPADKEVMIPVWKNLQSREAQAAGIVVRPTKGKNMPAGTLTGLFKRMGGRTLNGAGENQLWWGRVRRGGAKGLWLRPPREKVKKKGQAFAKKRNAHAPKLLIAAKDRVTYKPRLQQPFRAALKKASRQFPEKVREGVRRHVRMKAR